MSDNLPCYVLDSFALLAYLEGEAGAARVKEILAQAEEGDLEVLLCIINYGEVVYITEREQGLAQAHKAIAAVDQLPLQVVDANRPLVFAAAHIKAHHALSYADTLAVALAQDRSATLVTGDPEFKEVESLVTIEWLPSQ